MFFDFLFSKKPATPPASPAALAPVSALDAPKPNMAPGTRIAYSDSLVAQLKNDHQQLLGAHAAIGEAYAQGDLHATRELLESFRGDLQSHLLTENVRFYIYLEHSLFNDPEKQALVRQFRHEMDEIGKAALAFLMRYANIDRDDFEQQTHTAFASELVKIGLVLSQRIQREESSLYPLYQPL